MNLDFDYNGKSEGEKRKFDYQDFIRLEIFLLHFFRQWNEMLGKQKAIASLCTHSESILRQNPIYSWAGYKDLWCLMGIKYEILFSAEHWQWQHRRQKSEHSHVYGKRIDNSVFINTNWGFVQKLFTRQQT